MDVTVGLATLVFAGRLEQHPDLELIAATAGGAISLLAGRMDQAYQPRHWAGGGPPGGGPRGSPGGGPRAATRWTSGWCTSGRRRAWRWPPGGGPGAGGPAGRPPMAQYTNKITQPPSTYLRRVYVDTANSSVPNHLANLELMGADHMLFGTDSPPLATPLQDAIAMVDGLPISATEKQGILEDNARRLFGL